MTTVKIQLLLGWVMLCVIPKTYAQSAYEFKIAAIDTQGQKLNIRIKVLKNNRPLTDEIKRNDVIVSESIEGGKEERLGIEAIKNKLVYQQADSKEILNILFLVDVSNQMDATAIEMAKKMIREIVEQYQSDKNTQFFLASGLNNKPVKLLDANNLAGLVPSVETPDLYGTLREKAIFLSRKKGKQILFVFTNGVNGKIDSPTAFLPHTMEDVERQFKSMTTSFYCFPVGLGVNPQVNILKSLTDLTSNTQDTFSIGKIPENMGQAIQSNSVLESTHLISLNQLKNNTVFKGENRTYLVKLDTINIKSDTYPFKIGTPQAPVVLGKKEDLIYWIVWALFGVLILVAIIGLSIITIPFFRQRSFIKKYVQPYKPDSNRRILDPATNEPIKVGELVVSKCQQIIPLLTWNDYGGQCINYPDCMDGIRSCNGAGAPESSTDFFAMKGPYRRINWLWFGGLGGFIGWGLYAILRLVNMTGFSRLFEKVAGKEALTSDQIQTMTRDSLIGMVLGVGLVSMLSWVEERSQSRLLSVMRILTRTLLGAIAGLIIFSLGFYLQYANFITNSFLAGLIVWLFFGIIVGIILSINSSIILKRGILGGFLACLIGYLIYALIGFLFQDYDISGKLISMIALGSVLGLVAETVLTSLEDFELEYIAPEKYRHIVPISKWLKKGTSVIIGREPGCYVYIKWEDPAVEGHHARLDYDKGKVYITPFAETLIKGLILPLNRRTPLIDGDILQLGRDSVTRLRYKEKQSKNIPPQYSSEENTKERFKIKGKD